MLIKRQFKTHLSPACGLLVPAGAACITDARPPPPAPPAGRRLRLEKPPPRGGPCGPVTVPLPAGAGGGPCPTPRGRRPGGALSHRGPLGPVRRRPARRGRARGRRCSPRAPPRTPRRRRRGRPHSPPCGAAPPWAAARARCGAAGPPPRAARSGSRGTGSRPRAAAAGSGWGRRTACGERRDQCSFCTPVRVPGFENSSSHCAGVRGPGLSANSGGEGAPPGKC